MKNSNPEEKIRALMALVRKYAIACELDTAEAAAAGYAAVEASARALAAMPAAPVLVITGYQLQEALEFLAPDGTAEQLAGDACIQRGPERVHDEGTDPAGLYCWLADCPEEGSIPLTGHDARIMHPAYQAAPQAGGVPAGWKSEPTAQMLEAGVRANEDCWTEPCPDVMSCGVVEEAGITQEMADWCNQESMAHLKRSYLAMLAAAPTPPAVQPLSEAQIERMWAARCSEAWGLPLIAPLLFARDIERAHGIKESST